MTAQLPKGWESARLGSLGVEVKGQTRPIPEVVYDLYSVPAFALGRPERIDGANIRSGKRSVEAGDVLLCKINPRINRVWCVGPADGIPQIASTEYLVLRPSNKVLASYLCYYLSSPIFREWIELSVEGVTGSHTRAKSGPILDQMLPVAPIAEQKRIVEIIEDLFSRLDEVESVFQSLLYKLESLRAAILANAFHANRDLPPGWKWATAADVAHYIRGVTFKKVDSSTEEAPGLVPIARSGNVEPGRTRFTENLVYVPKERVAANQYLREGDVLIATSSGSLSVVGKSAIVADHWHGAHGAFMAVLRPTTQVYPRFLGSFLQSQANRKRWQELAAGTNINNLKKRDLLSTAIPLAPLKEQMVIIEEIGTSFSCLDSIETSLQEGLNRVKTLRRSVLTEAFAGRMVPQDSDDEPASTLLERITVSQLGKGFRRRAKI